MANSGNPSAVLDMREAQTAAPPALDPSRCSIEPHRTCPWSPSLVMHEKSQQNDDRQWNADEPKKQSSSEAHLRPPSLEFRYCFLNDKAQQRFPRPMERYYKLKVGGFLRQ
jgi:hypothetical protein